LQARQESCAHVPYALMLMQRPEKYDRRGDLGNKNEVREAKESASFLKKRSKKLFPLESSVRH
jgi:hypothetical protein